MPYNPFCDKNMKNKIPLIEIAKIFLTIGTIGFGGGMAIISLIQDYCVNKKKWLSIEEFSHGIALGQFLGPFAVNASVFIGYRVRKFKGAIVALISFLAPSFLFVIFLSALYMRFHKIPSLQFALNAISPVIIALILAAAFNICKGKIKNIETVLMILITIILSLMNVPVIVIILLGICYGAIRVRFLEAEPVNED